MKGALDVGCPEFLVSWVPSGMHLSLGPGPVQSEVLLAPPVPGLHLVHWAEDTAGSALAFDILRAQPRAVVERMVDAPPASVLAEIDFERATARADRLRMPVRVPRDVVTGGDTSRVVPIGPADDGARYVLVLPASHLLEDAATPVRTQRSEQVFPDLTVAVRAAVRAGAGQRTEPRLPMFVLSTASSGSFADRDVPTVHSAVVHQLVERFGQQYRESSIQLVGPNPGGLLREEYPQSFGLLDALQEAGHGHLDAAGRGVLLAELAAVGATLIGATDDIAEIPGDSDLRTLWLGGQVRPEDPVGDGPAQSQRFVLPIDWPARRDALSAVVGGLPESTGAVRAALNDWLSSVVSYRGGIHQVREVQGRVDEVLALRLRLAGDIEAHLMSGLAALDESPQATSEWWNEFRDHPDFDLSQLFQLAPVEIYGLLRRSVDLDWALGTTVVPESIKGRELGPPRPDKVSGRNADGLAIRVNPLWTPLAALTAAHFTDAPGLAWQFSVTRDGLPWFGSENVSQVVPEREWARLQEFRLATARRAVAAALRGESRSVDQTPDEDVPPPLADGEVERLTAVLDLPALIAELGVPTPTPERLRQMLTAREVRGALVAPEVLRKQVDGLGHPTIGARFGPDGAFVVGDNRGGGEVHYDPDDDSLIFNDQSGRTMSPKVRPTLTTKESDTWVTHVARMVSAQTGLKFEIGLSKQTAKAALKSSPRDPEALAKVAIVKAGLSDRRAVGRLREAADHLDARVAAALDRLPATAAKTEATRAWTAFRDAVTDTGGSTVGAAARAVAAYRTALSQVTSAVGSSAPRILPDPGYFFPLPVVEVPSGLWVGAAQVPDEAGDAVRRPGSERIVEVRFRANPDLGDIGLARLALLRQPVDVVDVAVHRPAVADLTDGFDAQARADAFGLPVDVARADAPPRYLTQPPSGSVWLDEHGRAVDHPEQAHYLRVRPTRHLVEQHLDHGLRAEPTGRTSSSNATAPHIASWRSEPRPRFARANRSRWQNALTHQDQAMVDAVVEAVHRVDSTTGPGRAGELAVVDALRSLHVLRDHHGAARRGEHLLASMQRRFTRDGRADPSRVRRMMLHHRTDLGSGREILGYAAAAVRLALAHGSALPAATIDLDTATLTVEFAAPGGTRPVLSAEQHTVPVDVVPVDRWPHALTDSALLVDGRLKIRSDASDRSLVLGFAGLFAQLATEGAAGLTRTLLADSAEALHAKRTILRRMHFGGSTWGTTRPKRWLNKHLSMPHTTEVLRAELRAIDDELAVADPGHSDTAVWGVDQPAHLGGRASFADHLARRTVAASSVATTFAGGLTNDPPRAMALMGASVAGTGAQSIVQAASDAAAASVSGSAASKAVLTAPKRWGERGRPVKTVLGLPTAQVTKRAPSALALAAASGLVTGLVGLDVPAVLDANGQVLAEAHQAHRWDLAGLSTALQGGQGLLTGAGSDWVFDLWEGRAKGAFERALSGSPDHRRNQYVEVAFHHALELYGRWAESLNSGAPVPEHLKADLADLVGQVDGLAQEVGREVDNKVADLRHRRRLVKRFGGMFGRQQGRQSYDLVDRGLPNGRPNIWHHMLRVGIQYSAAQVPSQVIGHLAGSAAGLADAGVLSGAGRGLAYGAGFSALKNHEFRDAVAVAAWDARFRLGVVRTLLDAIARGEAVADGVLPRAADPGRYQWLAKFSQDTARVLDQRRINQLVGRPTEISKRTQMIYKHVPSTAAGALGYGIAAGAGMIAAPVALPLILTVVGVLTATGVGETYLRTHEPRHRQAARFAGAVAEVSSQPRSSEQFVQVLRDNLREAAVANELVTPIDLPPKAGVLKRFGRWQRDGFSDVWVSGRRRVRRAVVWAQDQARAGQPPRHLARQPLRAAGPLHLTAADRAEVDALHEILTDLDTLKSWAVGDDTDRELLRTDLALHLDKIGLWQGAAGADWSWSQARWTAIAAALRSRHGRIDPLGQSGPGGVESVESMAALRRAESDPLSPYRVAVERERERTNHLWAGVARMSSTGARPRPWASVISPTKLQIAVGDLKSAELNLRVDTELDAPAEVVLRLRHWSAPTYELVVRDSATLHDPAALGRLLDGTVEHIRINRPDLGTRSWNLVQHVFRTEDRYPVLRRQLNPFGPPTWPLRLSPAIAAHPNLHVISSHDGPRPRQLIDQLIPAAARAAQPVILLDAPRIGHAVLGADLAAMNYLLEQFAQRDQLPVVVTRGRVSADVLDVAAKYGAAVLHPTLDKPVSAGLSSLQVGHRWRVTASRTGSGARDLPDSAAWDHITPAVLDAAARLARPTEAVSRVDDALGELIWSVDLAAEPAAGRTVFRTLAQRWSTDGMKSHLNRVKKMIERVPGRRELGILAPVLEFGAAGQADVVFDYAIADEARRPRVLLDSVGRLDLAGQLDVPMGVGLTTGALVSMVSAVGGDTSMPAVAVSVLEVLAVIRAGRFADAQTFIETNRGRFSPEEKGRWVDAIAGLSASMPGRAEQLERLSQAVLTC
ncbi:hypothetical protein [Micromonospora sp. NPDC049102]|uniref:hypothetical protein n=1 Tax=Micromonospora sp. NPDC049102 TaxID=3364265 RepID=UPI003719685C